MSSRAKLQNPLVVYVFGEERDPPITRKGMVIDFDNLAKMAWQDQAAES
jgi:hypothetical protein